MKKRIAKKIHPLRWFYRKTTAEKAHSIIRRLYLRRLRKLMESVSTYQ